MAFNGQGEQLVSRRCWRMKRADRRWLKRRHHKLRRLAEKRDPENAPAANRFNGWCD